MPKKITGSSNNLLIIFLGLSFCFFLTFSIIKIFNISSVKSQIKLEESTYEQNTAKLNQLRELSKRADEFKSALNMMNKLIPDQANESGIIVQVQGISSSEDVDFAKVEFADRVVNSNMNVMPMTLSFSGDYEGLVRLINNISSGERLIRVDGVNITKGEENAQLVSAEIKARSFYR